MQIKKPQIRNMAAMVVAANPIMTGFMFRRTSSNGLTPQIAAAGITDQGIIVPPPTQMAATWPNAVRVAIPLPREADIILATVPASVIPEKPEPSNPVIAPTTVEVIAPIVLFNGTILARATPRSLTNPVEPAGNTSPNR